MEARSQLRHRPTLVPTSSILVDKVQFVKRPREASRSGNSAAKGGIALVGMNISRTSAFSFPRCFQLATLLACVSSFAAAQQPAPAPAPASAPPIAIAISTEDIRPEVDRIYSAVSGINVPKWKAPKEVKEQTQSDIGSIQRNMKTTLPGLLDAAKTAPGTVAPAFAVYRNVCALYDVLLRVAETATLAGPQQEGALLEAELQKLDTAKKSLGSSIFDAAYFPGYGNRATSRLQHPAQGTDCRRRAGASEEGGRKRWANSGRRCTQEEEKARRPCYNAATCYRAHHTSGEIGPQPGFRTPVGQPGPTFFGKQEQSTGLPVSNSNEAGSLKVCLEIRLL